MLCVSLPYASELCGSPTLTVARSCALPRNMIKNQATITALFGIAVRDSDANVINSTTGTIRNKFSNALTGVYWAGLIRWWGLSGCGRLIYELNKKKII